MTGTVLVTGGTGFVAGWCIVELLRQGYEVRTTVRGTSRREAVLAAVSTEVDPADRLSFAVADLTSDAGWAAAVEGCEYVLHVASPLGADAPKDPDALVVPARDGALRVLRAATDAGVRRVVMTSACAAATPPLADPDSISDETRWTDTDDPTLTAYRKSKAVAEQAAWHYMRDQEGPTALATVLPGAVFGPLLDAANRGSVQVIERLLRGRLPGTPRIGFEVVDVRDLADLHVRAMTSPEAAGQRFIAAGEFLWMAEIAQELRAALGDAAGKVPTRKLPDFAMRLLARFDPGVRAVVPYLGRRHLHSADKARRMLAWQPRPAAETVTDCARSLAAHQVA
ncbi:NAD-dependent epimerase/dehydratase family protein [Streptomyces sp. NBC_00038]|uniref:NAD-dependent epimerase/dehydratase family protein n=1 Tax=Streptomyces sp. NBC_00038 TaxID=2903615 RepID=UPI0022512850|nr:NAD-dependent epimerase/dehydratase family protein [Streptomyces sp. NBC_00038]MCX5555062.1 NAD-dependent epimerase/dehydratase family protein [Streptomyces sp. NBC_00038]